MYLRELFQTPEPQPTQSVAVCFGRWNPPHKGHRAAWELASESDHWYVGTNHNTQGPDDPLPYDVKLICMQAVFPEIAGHVIPEHNLFTLVTKVYEKHGKNVNLKIVTDEAWLTPSVQKYNGKDAAHGFYDFASIEQVPSPRLSSATKLRTAVRNDDRAEFSAAAGIPADTPIKIGSKTYKFFDLVAHYLKEFPQKPKKK